MCDHGMTRMVFLNKQSATYSRNATNTRHVPVDACISREIQALNDAGVITYGCCCGHGKAESSCLIDETSIDKLKRLGYTPYEFSDMHTKQGIYEIFLTPEKIMKER